MAEIVGGSVLQMTDFGNESVSIPISGTDTSSNGFGGTGSPVFVYTGFPVRAAMVSFEREFSSGDAIYFDAYGDERSAARIRVREPINATDLGFYVDYGQESGFDQPFVLRFNWMAIGTGVQ